MLRSLNVSYSYTSPWCGSGILHSCLPQCLDTRKIELSTWDSKSCTLAPVITYPMPREQQHSTVRGVTKRDRKWKCFLLGLYGNMCMMGMCTQGISLVRGIIACMTDWWTTSPPGCILASARHHQLHKGTRRWDHYSCVCVLYCKHSSTTVCVLVCKPVRKRNSSNLIGPHIHLRSCKNLENC